MSFGESYDFLTPRIITDNTKSPLFLKSPKILAEQLCVLDQKQFCQIEVHEFIGQKWNVDNAFDLTPNITRCIEFFNRLSYWCATEILSQSILKQRVCVLKLFLKIANVSFSLRNWMGFSCFRSECY